MAALTLTEVNKAYGKIEVLSGINLDIQEGEFIAFVGPSGCGKSTLLRMIAGLERITGGDLFIGEHRMNDVPPAQRGIAMVFQSYALYPHMSVYENMAFGLKLAKLSKADIDQRVREAATILKLDTYLDRLPKQLSGGQRQRVAIGRAIVRQPKVFLFDEPLSNLDASLRVQTRFEIAKLHKDLGNATMIYVTHDQVEAMTLADRIVVLNGGGVEQVGAPLDLYHNPVNTFVAGFIGSPKMNFMDVTVTGVSATGTTVQLPGGSQGLVPRTSSAVAVGQTIQLGIRPEHMSTDGDLSISGTVAMVENLGEAAYRYVDIGAATSLIAKSEGEIAPETGQEVAITFKAEDCQLFDADGIALPKI